MWQKRVWCFGTRSLLLFLLLFNKSSAVGESADPHIELKSCTQELEVLPNSDMTCINKQTDTSKHGMSDLVTTCQLKCKPGYSFSYNTTADFLQQTCNNITGLWSGQTANNFFGKWGDICTKSTNPISRTSTTTVYMAQQDGIEDKCPTMGDINTAISTFTQDKISLLVCVGKDTCEPVNEKTECEVTRPPKDSLSINQLANVLKITFTYKQKGSLDDAKVVQYFAQSIDYLVSNGEFILHFTVSKKRATVKYTALTDVTTSSNTFICSPGFGKIGDYCTECPRGYFLNPANDNCQGCDKGTYSDTEASLQCKTCPNNLGTFLPNSTSITDCVKPCTVKKTNNGTVLPEVEWEVTTNTQVYITCNTDHALTYQADNWYICSDEAPHCYKICTLDPIPDNVMLVHPDTNASTLVHGNKTTVACVDFIAYHTVTCNDGNLNWPVCKNVNYSAIGIRIWVLFGAVLVLGLAFIIFFTVTENLRRTKIQEYKGGNYAAIHTNLENPMEKPIISLPIHVEEFSSKVEALNRDLQRYRTEYQLIPLDDSEQQKLIGMASWNRRKNNTEARGIVPYDVSRVLLTQEPDQRFYYNASYINGWKGPKHYIAAQTPLSNTRADFWRLICDTNMSMFINLHQSEDADNPTEYSKYWPDQDGLYDGILVRKMSEIKYNGFIIREFKVGRVEDAAEYFSKTPTPMPPGSPLTGSIAADEVAIVDSTTSMAVDTPAATETLTETKAAETEDLPNTDTAETEAVASVTQDTTDEKEDTTKKTTSNGLTDNVGEEGEMGAEKGYIAGRVTVGSTEESDNKSVLSKATTMTYRRRDRHQSRFSSVPSSRCSNYATKYNLILDWDYSFMLKQVVFTGWNEDETPDMEKFRNMIYVTRDLAARDIGTSPRLVHSDVGSDWASIYIAVDYTLDRLISKTDIDICGLTNALRQQRPVMVTTVESYIYLYNFVNNILSQHSYEDMKYGGFVLKVEDLPDEQSSTSKPQPGLLEEGAQSMRAFSRATMRSVEQGRQSVVQSVSRLGDAAMSIFGSISNSLTASSQQQLTKIEEE